MANDLMDLGIMVVGMTTGIQVACCDGVVTVAANWTTPKVHRYSVKTAERKHAKLLARL